MRHSQFTRAMLRHDERREWHGSLSTITVRIIIHFTLIQLNFKTYFKIQMYLLCSFALVLSVGWAREE